MNRTFAHATRAGIEGVAIVFSRFAEKSGRKNRTGSGGGEGSPSRCLARPAMTDNAFSTSPTEPPFLAGPCAHNPHSRFALLTTLRASPKPLRQGRASNKKEKNRYQVCSRSHPISHLSPFVSRRCP